MDKLLKILIIILLLTILGFNVLTLIQTTSGSIIDGGNVIIKETEKDINSLIKMVEKPVNNNTFEPDEKSIRKSKYCYIGSDRGHRSCIKIENDDMCQSKEVHHNINACLHH